MKIGKFVGYIYVAFFINAVIGVGAEKARRIREAFGESELRGSYTDGNSLDDKAMLELAEFARNI